MAAAIFLFSGGRVRGYYDTDNWHRRNNNARLAVQRAGLWPSMAKLIMVAGINKGPWNQNGFLEKKAEALARYLDAIMRDPGEMAIYLDGIAFDHGHTAGTVTSTSVCDVIVQVKLAMSRWTDMRSFSHRSGSVLT